MTSNTRFVGIKGRQQMVSWHLAWPLPMGLILCARNTYLPHCWVNQAVSSALPITWYGFAPTLPCTHRWASQELWPCRYNQQREMPSTYAPNKNSTYSAAAADTSTTSQEGSKGDQVWPGTKGDRWLTHNHYPVHHWCPSHNGNLEPEIQTCSKINAPSSPPSNV